MVEITTNTQTIELTGEETQVHFSSAFPYFWLRNDGTETVLVSLSPNIEEGKDGVIEVLAGSSAGTMHGFEGSRNDLYLLGSGKVQVMGTYSADNPFKTSGKGGENGNSGNNILPHSEGLTYYFDYQKNISDTGWTDIVQGYKINQNMLYNSEYAALEESAALNWNMHNTFTVYCIFKSINYSGNIIDILGIKNDLYADQLMIINWGNNRLGYQSKPGSCRIDNSSSFNYNILALIFFEGTIHFYINGEKVDSRSYSLNFFDFKSWHISGTSEENKREVYFKMVAFYENVAQTSDIVLENTKYIAQKYEIEI